MFAGESPKIAYAQQSFQPFSKHITALDWNCLGFLFISECHESRLLKFHFQVDVHGAGIRYARKGRATTVAVVK